MTQIRFLFRDWLILKGYAESAKEIDCYDKKWTWEANSAENVTDSINTCGKSRSAMCVMEWECYTHIE